jgi:phosphoglycerol transferase
MISPDEFGHSARSRLLQLSESDQPGWVFQLIYRSSNQCGAEFYSCVKLLNSFFIVLGTVLFFLLAKLLIGFAPALLLALVTIIGPLNFHTSMFMVETINFAAFSLVAYSFLRIRTTNFRKSMNLVPLLSIALLFSVQTKAFIHIPAFIIYFWISLGNEPSFKKRTLALVKIFLAVMIARQAIGFTIAGTNSFSLLGNFYETAAQRIQLPSFSQLTSDYLLQISGHLLSISILFPMVIFALFGSKRQSGISNSDQRIKNFKVFITCDLLVHLLFTSFFATITTKVTEFESISRINQRYYDFLFPFMILIALHYAGSLPQKINKIEFRVVVPALIVCTTGFFVIGIKYLDNFQFYSNDAPYIASAFYSKNSVILYLFSLFSVLGTIFYLKRWRVILLLISNTILVIFISIGMNQGIQRYEETPNQYANGVEIFSNYLKSKGEQKSEVLFISPDPGQNSRILFQYDSLNGSVLNSPTGSQVDFAEFSEQIEYVVTLDTFTNMNAWEIVLEQGPTRIFQRKF